jgi:hypothetical protein
VPGKNVTLAVRMTPSAASAVCPQALGVTDDVRLHWYDGSIYQSGTVYSFVSQMERTGSVLVAANGAVNPGEWSVSVDIDQPPCWLLSIDIRPVKDGLSQLAYTTAPLDCEWFFDDVATATVTVLCNGIEYILSMTVTLTSF